MRLWHQWDVDVTKTPSVNTTVKNWISSVSASFYVWTLSFHMLTVTNNVWSCDSAHMKSYRYTKSNCKSECDILYVYIKWLNSTNVPHRHILIALALYLLYKQETILYVAGRSWCTTNNQILMTQELAKDYHQHVQKL